MNSEKEAKLKQKEADKAAKEALKVAEKEAKLKQKLAEKAAKEAQKAALKAGKLDTVLKTNGLKIGDQEPQYVTFSKNGHFQCLSNYAPLSVEWEGVNYPTAESAFQASKFITISDLIHDPERSELMKQFATTFNDPQLLPNDAKLLGERGFKLEQHELELWLQNAVAVQLIICRTKMFTHDIVRQQLLTLKGKTIIHAAQQCSQQKAIHCFWEGKPVIRDGTLVVFGHNWLGKIWTIILNTYADL